MAPPILLRKADSAERVEEAWGAFKAAFSAPRTCLLLHQKNHYSLVFALREWTEPPPAEDAAATAAADDGSAPHEGRVGRPWPLPGPEEQWWRWRRCATESRCVAAHGTVRLEDTRPRGLAQPTRS